MPNIESDDGETFTLQQDGVQIVMSRQELEILMDRARFLLTVTKEFEIVPIEDEP
jgi:hypothetical protein